MAAEMGSLVDKDKVRIVLLKVQGAAQIFLDTHPEVNDSITYKNLEKLLKDRFQEKHSDFYNYTQLQAAKQEKDETPDDFADRLRKLSRNTLHVVEDANAQIALTAEAERRLLAVFIKGNPGLQVRYQMPETLEKALKIATTAAQAEIEREKTQRDRFPPRVFGVRGFSHSNQRGRGRWGNNNNSNSDNSTNNDNCLI